ncbi:MAG: hypothetical protein Q8920_17705 [Bacillota bacterium]|nr:hypothetical protein [Bacillota bacterium]MDP4134216.1 hypothetical protein [Bacillota bacterium]
MSWKQEIFRALLLSLGAFEVLSNLNFILRKNGLQLARKQHQELPKNISDKKMLTKVVLMLLFGAAFFSVSLISYITHGFITNAFLCVLILFCAYGVCEAVYYRYWRTFGFASLTVILLSVFIFV